MSDKRSLSVLVDTSFLISVYDSSRQNHATAKKYYKYFLRNAIKMHLSTIVISEFQQMQPIVDIINTGHFMQLPFNYEEAIKTAEIAYNLGGTDRRGQSQPKYKDDLKLMAQAEHNEINFIITEDESTLARYCEKLSKAGMFKPEIIIVSKGFQSSWFNDGQSSLIDNVEE
jgi:predicted nucleic acid-binding protein